MTKMLLFILFTGNIFALAVCLAVLHRIPENKVRDSLILLIVSASVSALGMEGMYVLDNYWIKMVMSGFFYSGMTWCCWGILGFVQRYTEVREFSPWMRKGFIAVSGVDSVMMLTNFRTGAAADFSAVPMKDFLFLSLQPKFFFYVHLGWCYFMLAVAFALLIAAVWRSPSLYKIRYIASGSVLLAAVVLDCIFLMNDFMLDLSVLTFAFVACAMVYFTFFYIPGTLRRRMHEQVMAHVNDGFVFFDRNGACIYRNSLMDSGHFPPMSHLEEFCSELEKGREENCYRFAEDGFSFSYDIRFGELRDSRNRYIGCYYQFHDVSAEELEASRSQYAITHDLLTGLWNRGYFIEKTREMLRNNPDTKYIMICSDLRRFKVVNEIFGTKVGDNILCGIADYLRQYIDENRTICRLGEDSFAMCVPKDLFDEENYLKVSREFIDSLNLHYSLINHTGIYEIEDNQMQVTAMCDRAFLALNSIKEEYSWKIEYFSDEMRQEILKEQSLLKSLDTAFEKDEFEIYLQPQYSCENGSMKSAEALARWRHPERGLIPPGIFIPVLEKTGLIARLDLLVWEKACILIRKMEDAGIHDLSISVNVSTKDFFYLDIAKEICALVDKYKISKKMLNIEITEGAFSVEAQKHIQVVEKLRSEGFTVEMDDFGSGYSSLNALKDIPVDVLKLDLKFLTGADTYGRSVSIVRNVVNMASEMEMPVIAEGIETEDQARFLTEIGCTLMQGFLYAKPMPETEFGSLIGLEL